ncbi:hypothetical protein J4434_06180 [Candidatus Woesearchaeota archaeon]|nr:hypothetical protein [Candidatus Woesearchaeota archaeon]
MNTKTKKSQMMTFTLVGVLIMLFLLFILLFESNLFIKYKETTSLNNCRQSTMLASFKQPTVLATLTGAQESIEKSGKDINCPIIYKKIKEYNGKETDNYYINKVIADQMAGCWYKFNEGNVNLFSKVHGETTEYCVVCSVISFEEDAKNNEVNGLLNFIASKNTPALFGTKTYIEYLSGVATDVEMQKKIKEQDTSSINTASDYIVLFYYPKKGYYSEAEAVVLGSKVGGGVGGVLTLVLKYLPQAKAVSWVGGKWFIMGSSAVGGWIGSFFGHGKGYEYGAQVLLLPYHQEMLKEMKCEMPVPLGYRPD